MQEVFGLQNERALVVGGGYGSGRELAHLLAKAGAKVAVADIDPARAQKVAEEVGGIAVTGDVTTEEGARGVVAQAVDKLGGLSRLANIVGQVKWGSFMETDLAHWQAQIQLNLMQHMMVCHAAGPHLFKSGKSAIALVASVSGIYGARNQVAYGVAKAGVISLMKTLADEWGPHGVRVNAVAPDLTGTPRLLDQMQVSHDQAFEKLDAMAAEECVPLRRFGRAHEIAGPLFFLLSDLSSFMTGQCLVNDGGTMVHFPHDAGATAKK